MKTKTVENGNIKVWYDTHEDEFLIVNKNQPLYDTLIDANLIQRKYSKMLIEEIRKAGLDSIHGVFIELDDSLQNNLDNLNVSELDKIFSDFNAIFATRYRYRINSNGLKSIVIGEFKSYQEFVQSYFGTFLLKLFAGRIDILKSEEENPELQGLTDFIAKFAPEYMKIYLATSKTMKFAWVINIVYNKHNIQYTNKHTNNN